MRTQTMSPLKLVRAEVKALIFMRMNISAVFYLKIMSEHEL